MSGANTDSKMRTVKVERLLQPTISVDSDGEIHVSLYFVDSNGKIYHLGHLDYQKIFIEDEG
jgi:hypothetical protein